MMPRMHNDHTCRNCGGRVFISLKRPVEVQCPWCDVHYSLEGDMHMNLAESLEAQRDLGDHYPEFRERIARRISKAQWPLFTTNADPETLAVRFMGNLPHSHQHYNCRTCLNFIMRYGGLVTIEHDGAQKPLLWGQYSDLEYFRASEKALWRYVKDSKVTGVFVPSRGVWGTPETPPWTHLYGNPMAYHVPHGNATNFEASKAMAEYKEDYAMLQRGLHGYPTSVFETAVRVLEHTSIHRGEKFVDHAKWLLELRRALERAGYYGNKAANLLWKAVATAPVSWCHVKSSALGTLLEDIHSGHYTFDQIKLRFEEKLHPLRYQRPQVVKEGTLDRAEKLIAELGLKDSLKRRFAHLIDVNCFWSPRPFPKAPLVEKVEVFGHLRPQVRDTRRKIELPTQTMTWVKFRDAVLPQACVLEYRALAGKAPFVALVAPKHKYANPILKWSNGISWYLYHGGSFASDWNVRQTWTPVTGLARHPAVWCRGYTEPDDRIFFLLEGCRDLRYGESGGGFFPTQIRSDLHEIRSALEAYTKFAVVEGASGASACGIMAAKGGQWNITLRVNGQDNYLIDRWD